jgi:hypothetical protein
MVSKKNILYISGGIISALFSAYCFLGMIMSAWLSATPGYDINSAQKMFYLWLFGAIASLLLFVVFLVAFLKERKKKVSGQA